MTLTWSCRAAPSTSQRSKEQSEQPEHALIKIEPAITGGTGKTSLVEADMPDVDALRRLRKAQIPALLYGPPGTGKTSLVEAAFDDLITVAGDGDTAVADFVGEYTQTEAGAYAFVYGPLVTAMREGRCLFIDGATLISPKVLAVVYPAMKAPEFVITEMLSTRTWAWSGAVGRLGARVRSMVCPRTTAAAEAGRAGDQLVVTKLDRNIVALGIFDCWQPLVEQRERNSWQISLCSKVITAPRSRTGRYARPCGAVVPERGFGAVTGQWKVTSTWRPPSRLGRAVSVAPWAWAMARTMARPSPWPSV
jgi:hypothetical protein